MLIVGQVQVTKFLDALPAGANHLGSVDLSSAVAIASGQAVGIDPNANGVRLTEALPAGSNLLGKVEISNAAVPVSAASALPVRETFADHQILTLVATAAAAATGAFASPVSQVMVLVDADCRVAFGAYDPAATGLRMKQGESIALPLTTSQVRVIGETGSVTARVIGLR